MDLHHVKIGTGPIELIILHGLFGSSKNWIGTARDLSDIATVYALDLRNHGDSPHTNTHTIIDLAEDLADFMRSHLAGKPVILGHSMGGLAAMAFALRYPNSPRALIIEDIAPRSYHPGHELEFKALTIDVSWMKMREEVDRAMASIVPDLMLRRFLQMNLERSDSGFRWKLNVEVLSRSTFVEEFSVPQGAIFPGQTLLIAGGLSSYVQPEDHRLMRAYFPNSRIEVIPDADHWLHHTKHEEFLRLVRDFLIGPQTT
jgi:pimeloyl-ACP methyl ester carboxylesterase